MSAFGGSIWDGDRPSSGHQAPGDPEAPRTLRREHDQLGGRRLDPRERENDGAVGDEHHVAAGGLAPRDLAQRGQLLRLAGAVVEEIAESRPGLGGAEGEPRGLETSAPRAREHASERNTAGPERGPDAPGVVTAWRMRTTWPPPRSKSQRASSAAASDGAARASVAKSAKNRMTGFSVRWKCSIGVP